MLPPSPPKNYKISSAFSYNFRLALTLLPYKTLYLSSVKDRHGVFAFISKDERRDLPLRKQRPSVRAQLKEGQSKKTAAPKKAAAKAKDNDLEV